MFVGLLAAPNHVNYHASNKKFHQSVPNISIMFSGHASLVRPDGLDDTTLPRNNTVPMQRINGK